MKEVELLIRKATLLDMQLWLEEQLLEVEQELAQSKSNNKEDV